MVFLCTITHIEKVDGFCLVSVIQQQKDDVKHSEKMASIYSKTNCDITHNSVRIITGEDKGKVNLAILVHVLSSLWEPLSASNMSG